MNVRKLKRIISEKITAEIPANLTYHGLHHTLDVYESCNDYVKRMNISPEDAYLLRTAALTHDIGIITTYSDHEAEGIKYVNKLLPTLGYTKKQIKIVVDLIWATQLPQNPKNKLQRIICDADLDYLGTDRFYPIGDTLFKEFLEYNVVNNEREWDELQVRFLEGHSYHTAFAKKHREPVKQKYLQELKVKLGIVK